MPLTSNPDLQPSRPSSSPHLLLAPASHRQSSPYTFPEHGCSHPPSASPAQSPSPHPRHSPTSPGSPQNLHNPSADHPRSYPNKPSQPRHPPSPNQKAHPPFRCPNHRGHLGHHGHLDDHSLRSLPQFLSRPPSRPVHRSDPRHSTKDEVRYHPRARKDLRPGSHAAPKKHPSHYPPLNSQARPPASSAATMDHSPPTSP